MVTEKNNMHDVDTFMFFQVVFQGVGSGVSRYRTPLTITMAVFDMAQHVVSGAAGVIGGDTNIDVDAALSSMQAGLNAMEIPELLLLVMETSLVSLCMKIMSVLITVILYGRMIEIYALLFRIAYPVCHYDQQRVGADRQQLPKGPVRPRFSRLPHYDMRRHLCGFGWRA